MTFLYFLLQMRRRGILLPQQQELRDTTIMNTSAATAMPPIDTLSLRAGITGAVAMVQYFDFSRMV